MIFNLDIDLNVYLVKTLFDKIKELLSENFCWYEYNFSDLTEQTKLILITENNTIYYFDKVCDMLFDEEIASLCFYNDNILYCVCANKIYQNKGYTKRLLTELIKDTNYLLHVRKSNTNAINLYKKLGFKEVEEVKLFYPDGENAFKMDNHER